MDEPEEEIGETADPAGQAEEWDDCETPVDPDDYNERICDAFDLFDEDKERIKTAMGRYHGGTFRDDL